ncbi:protein IQ-DOMAIN 32-like [Olea europaea var. sylvestris]|uniref:protein IQ-DOMAIN 32-like n=1 Tax=Olea europaea var. sylvestris TaxID=158386 RepID=UPI000C1D78D7|nr:protein IQ-DOMAIN 32-like [Olea europaea var. sylvestris]
MGRSASSCFKIITCSCDSVDHDDLQTPENKGSSDRSGWGFRKRSTRHRVLSNSVISEATSSVNKENSESTAVDFQEQHRIVPEKSSTDGKSELSTEVNSKLLDAVVARDDDATLDEFTVILIQAAIRGFLAQRGLLKLKNIIKLQAAFRGHIVRKHATGTLRCALAIIKMQALVRGRHARRRVEGSNAFEKQSENCGNAYHDSTIVGMSKNEANRNVTISIEKLLSNGFARQLLDSTPRTKPINIKCDPSKSDSAWKWLEMWMSVSLMSNNESQASGLATEQHEREELGHPDRKDDIVIPSECTSESVGFKSSAEASSDATENADNLDLQSCRSTTPSLSQKVELPEPQNFNESNMTCNVTDSLSIPLNETDMLPKVESKSDPGKPEREPEQEIHHDEKKFSTKQPETELSDLFDESNTTYNVNNSAPIQLNQTDLLVKVELESDPGKVEREHEQDIHHNEEKISTKRPETEPPEPFDDLNTIYNVNNALPTPLNKTDLLVKMEHESDPLKSEREHEQDIQQDEEEFSTKQPENELPEPFDESNTTYNAKNALPIQLNKTDLLEKVEPASDPGKTEGEHEQDINHDEEKFSTNKPETEPPEPFGESNSYHVTDSSHIQLNGTDLLAKVEPESDPGEAEREHKQYIHHDEEKFSTEQPEMEAKKFSFGSRNTSNPSYIDAQLKFEELSSAASTPQLTSSTGHGPETEYNSDKTDQQFGSGEVGLPENSTYQASTVQGGTPGSGTELLTASNPDSSDRSEVEAVEYEPKQKISDETDYPKSEENLEVEANDKPSTPATDLPSINSDQLELDCGVNSSYVECASSIIPLDSPQVEKKPDTDPSKMHLELGSEVSHPVYKSSEASPESHITVSESQATPSTQVSIEFKEIRGKKTDSNRKSRYPSAGKGPPSSDNHDSVARCSLEQLPMEHKTGKRRKSFGSARPDHGDREPRDSCNSLPGYMQATESTRAKAIANRSPRSSPDMQDKDIYVKKRQSLPGGNEQQGSPHRQWSMSQAQQNSPGNGIHSPQERRWRS